MGVAMRAVHATVNTEVEPQLAAALLFAQPGALPAPALEELVTKIKELDMDAVRAEIAAANLTDA